MTMLDYTELCRNADDATMLEPEYNWEDTALMSTYDCDTYDYYKSVQKSIFEI